MSTAAQTPAARIEERADFGLVRYANCWEDADILCEALRPAPGKRFLSIASAGDNALALAAEGAEVVAADLSAAQLACVELRRAAFRRLDYEPVLAFIGVSPSDTRQGTYRGLRDELSPPARGFWDGRAAEIRDGFIHAGKFENYFRLFRTRVLPLVHSRRRVAALLEERDLQGRSAFYSQQWDTIAWRMLFRVFFSRFVMGRLGRDPEFFRYVEGSVAQRILGRARHALTVLPTHANPYLQYILNGNYGPALPRYLRRENFDAVRAGLDRLTLYQGPIESAARAGGAGGFDGFNLFDIFEYLDPVACLEIYRELLARSRPGARLAFWNMLVPRSVPVELADRVTQLDELGRDLLARDKAFFYSAMVVEEVR